MSTYFPSGKELAGRRKWYVVDAAGQTLGHVASEVASILTGKRSPQWTPFLDTGDHVIVINAKNVVLRGNKVDQKLYRHHTRYPGGLRQTTARELLAKKPEKVLELAIRGMLPKTKLGKAMAKKLKVYANSDHPHTAQSPQVYQLQHQPVSQLEA
jgi:large subunit ribosomal protein L13